jgi:hypothetical protein
MNADSKQKPLHENLDTTFVNLWSLLRTLTQKNFIGRVHVELTDYSADIFMNGSSTPVVHEIDRTTGTETTEETGLHRVVLRARETPGTINVFEGATEATPVKSDAASATAAPSAPSPEPVAPRVEVPQSAPAETTKPTSESRPAASDQDASEALTEDLYRTGSYQDWPAILATTGELIAAIERGLNATGGNFDSLFGGTRLELADDYSFLDPMARKFNYENGVASLGAQLSVNVFVSGLSEALRRTVDRAAVGDRARRVRERVAIEMLSIARKRSEVMERSGFGPQLDRIAGTRVR